MSLMVRSARPAESPRRQGGGGSLLEVGCAVLLATGLFAFRPSPCLAQDTPAPPAEDSTGHLLGQVLDATTGEPIPLARLTLADLGRRAVTDSAGRFDFAFVPAGTHDVRIEHVRYGSQSTSVTVAAGEAMGIELRFDPRAIALDPLEVSVRALDPDLLGTGFYRRQMSGRGGFYAEEEYLEQPVRKSLSWQRARETMRGVVLRLGMRPNRKCAEVLIDGRRRLPGEKIWMHVVAGIEVYGPHQAPLHLYDRSWPSQCGLVLVWTKDRVNGDDPEEEGE